MRTAVLEQSTLYFYVVVVSKQSQSSLGLYLFHVSLNPIPCGTVSSLSITMSNFLKNSECARWWWRTPLILALGRQKQEDLCEFEASLVYRASPKTGSKVTEKPCLRKRREKKRKRRSETLKWVKKQTLNPGLRVERAFTLTFIASLLPFLPLPTAFALPFLFLIFKLMTVLYKQSVAANLTLCQIKRSLHRNKVNILLIWHHSVEEWYKTNGCCIHYPNVYLCK